MVETGKAERWLITGASSGIGAAFAAALAARGADLVLVARRADRLADVAGQAARSGAGQVQVLPEDLADIGAPARIGSAMPGPVHGIINAAGFSPGAGFCDAAWSDHQTALQVMAIAPVEICHRLVSGMVEQGRGRIINVSSLLGAIAHPGRSHYGPIKSYLIAASRTLREDVLGSGVHVTALCPGLTDTEIFGEAGPALRAQVPRLMWQTPGAVARIGLRAVERNRAVAVCGAVNKVQLAASRLLPTPAIRAITQWAQGRDG